MISMQMLPAVEEESNGMLAGNFPDGCEVVSPSCFPAFMASLKVRTNLSSAPLWSPDDMEHIECA